MAVYFKDPVEVLNYIHDKLDSRKETAGLKFVGYGEERLIPEYPAVLVGAGPVTREWHTTHKWNVTLMLELWIYHANLNDSHRVRTREDLELVGKVREVVHDDLRLQNSIGEPQCVMSYISAEDPAFIRRLAGEAVVGTRLEHTTISQENFK